MQNLSLKMKQGLWWVHRQNQLEQKRNGKTKNDASNFVEMLRVFGILTECNLYFVELLKELFRQVRSESHNNDLRDALNCNITKTREDKSREYFLRLTVEHYPTEMHLPIHNKKTLDCPTQLNLLPAELKSMN